MFINAVCFIHQIWILSKKKMKGVRERIACGKEVRKAKLQKIDFHGADGAGGDAQLQLHFRVKQDFLRLYLKG